MPKAKTVEQKPERTVIETTIPEIIMIQSVGKFGKAMDCVKDRDPAAFYALAKGVHEDWLKEAGPENEAKVTIGHQSVETLIFEREFAQNALYAYGEGENKRIQYTVYEDGKDIMLEVRDWGSGMSPEQVMDLLLTPFKTGEPVGKVKVGEHGIGWFTVLSASDDVKVFSANGKKASESNVRFEDGEWRVRMEILSDVEALAAGRGTTMVVRIDPERVVSSELDTGTRMFGARDTATKMELAQEQIGKALRTYAGLIDSKGAEITLKKGDGEPERINDRDEEFEFVGAASFTNEKKGRMVTDDLRISISPTRPNWAGDWEAIITQKGLFCGSKNPFESNGAHHELMKAMIKAGIMVWIDMPINVTTTASRNDIAGGDRKERQRFNEALCGAFEECVLERILTDEKFVAKMDHCLSDWVKRLLEGSYNNEKIHMAGTDFFKVKHVSGEGAVQLSGDGVAAFSAHGFAGHLLEKKWIPGVRRSGESEEKGKFSINELIEAHKAGALHDTNGGREGDGIYVNYNSGIVQPILYTLGQAKEGVDRYNRQVHEDLAIPHTSLSIIKAIHGKTGVCEEYVALLEIADYLDNVVSAASNVRKSQVMLHHMQSGFGLDTAHTDQVNISLNLMSNDMTFILEALRKGSLGEDELFFLIDILIHEKAHVATGSFSAASAEGKAHYAKKEEIIRQVAEYCTRNGLDPLKSINESLAQVKFGEPTDTKKLRALILEETGAALPPVANEMEAFLRETGATMEETERGARTREAREAAEKIDEEISDALG